MNSKVSLRQAPVLTKTNDLFFPEQCPKKNYQSENTFFSDLFCNSL